WLALPLACIALWGDDRGIDRGRTRAPLAVSLLVASAPIVGTAIFSMYLQMRFADALAWVHGQAAWGMPLFGRWAAPDPVPLEASIGVRAIEWISYVGNIAAFVLAVAAIRPVSRRVGIA